MVALLIAFLTAMLMAFYSLVLPIATPVEKASSGAEAVAFAMHAYHKAAVSWCENDDSNCADGSPTRDQMPLPSHFDAGSWLQASIADKIIVTYATNPPVPASALVKGLISTGVNPDNVGLAAQDDSGVLRLHGLGNQDYWNTIGLPAAIPAGAAIIVTKR